MCFYTYRFNRWTTFYATTTCVARWTTWFNICTGRIANSGWGCLFNCDCFPRSCCFCFSVNIIRRIRCPKYPDREHTCKQNFLHFYFLAVIVYTFSVPLVQNYNMSISHVQIFLLQPQHLSTKILTTQQMCPAKNFLRASPLRPH